MGRLGFVTFVQLECKFLETLIFFQDLSIIISVIRRKNYKRCREKGKRRERERERERERVCVCVCVADSQTGKQSDRFFLSVLIGMSLFVFFRVHSFKLI